LHGFKKRTANEHRFEYRNHFVCNIGFFYSYIGYSLSNIQIGQERWPCTLVRDIFYIARPIDGNEYIIWVDEAFFTKDEARRINMIILNAIFSSEEP
jgi:hypothetical protein